MITTTKIDDKNRVLIKEVRTVINQEELLRMEEKLTRDLASVREMLLEFAKE
jgi:hypothetical protein